LKLQPRSQGESAPEPKPSLGETECEACPSSPNALSSKVGGSRGELPRTRQFETHGEDVPHSGRGKIAHGKRRSYCKPSQLVNGRWRRSLWLAWWENGATVPRNTSRRCVWFWLILRVNVRVRLRQHAERQGDGFHHFATSRGIAPQCSSSLQGRPQLVGSQSRSDLESAAAVSQSPR
jgi:hypothetical protein